MQKQLLWLVLLFLSIGSAAAQNPVTDESLASQQLKQRLRGKYLTNDTAQAIINLYGRRQAGGVSWVVAAVLSAVRIGTASSSGGNYGGYATQTDNSNNMGAAFLLATPIAAYGVGKLVHYSNTKLERVLTAYAAGQPLPHSLRRKLKPRFFNTPIVKYAPVKYKTVN
jgi:hypothetical protein